MMISLFVFLSLACSIINLSFAKDRLSIRVINHAPCIRKGTKAPWPLLLPSIKEAPVKKDPDNENCYRITGDVKVNLPVRGKLYAYVEVKNEVGGQPRNCTNAKSNGCGGIGSCVFCDLCKQVKVTNDKKKKDEQKESLWMEMSGSKFDCTWGFELGLFKQTSVVFCMPRVDEFVKMLDIDRKTWDHFMGNGRGSQTAFMTYYLFEDEPINRMSKSALQNKVANMQGVVGCHRIVMDVYSS